ncbi:TniQ protein [Devosia lucknowensis]|uniref:TniQ protein n=1 Tax=Devosia lucknowensis TaxID=1096929 RepID=A0A1Y6G6V7_9HYPH|nr:TniQ family protein [Devosia lucknowensis]SMQ85901.1 TniQ protein [Devosia lucknowensis]
MNTHFVRRPLRYHHRLQARETGLGFASRLAAMNGRHMVELLQHMGVRTLDVNDGVEDAIRAVAALGDADAKQLITMTPRPSEGEREYHVAGEVLGPLGINRTFFRYCPHCVLEDVHQFEGPLHARPWLRLEWTISHYRACHLHHTELLECKPVRRHSQPYDFSEAMMTLLPNMDRLATTAFASKPSGFDEWIIARIEGARDPDNWLDALPLYVAAQWCEAFGVSLLHPAKVQTSRLTEVEWAAAAEEGFSISRRGATAIDAALQRLTLAEKRTRGIVGPRDTYGYGFHLLQKTVTDPAFEPIRKIVRDHAMQALPWKIGTDMLGVTIEENQVLTVQTASLASGVDRKTMRNVLKRNGLALQDIEDGLRDHRVVVSTRDIEGTVRKLKGALTAPQTMELLGIDRRQLDAIVEAGGLADASGAPPDHWGQARYAPEDIELMLVRLMDGAVEVEAPTKRQVGIPRARHVSLASNTEIMRFIFERRLTWKGRLAGQTGFHALLLDVDECIELIRASAPPMDGLLFIELEREIIGFNKNAVPHLVRLKKLDKDEEYSPSARRLVPVITRASVDEFRRKYVTAGELCQVHGLHHKQVRSILDSVGIKEEFDAKTVKVTFYDRQKVEAAATKRRDFWVYRK